MSKEELLNWFDLVTQKEWDSKIKLIEGIRFLSKLVDLVILFLTSCTHDIDFVNKAEDFVIAVATIFYRKRVKEGCFLKMR